MASKPDLRVTNGYITGLSQSFAESWFAQVSCTTRYSAICHDLSLSLLAVSHCSEPEEKRWQFHTDV